MELPAHITILRPFLHSLMAAHGLYFHTLTLAADFYALKHSPPKLRHFKAVLRAEKLN